MYFHVIKIIPHKTTWGAEAYINVIGYGYGTRDWWLKKDTIGSTFRDIFIYLRRHEGDLYHDGI